jgi:hypothetical protein
VFTVRYELNKIHLKPRPKALPCPRRLVEGLEPRISESDPRSGGVRVVVGKMALGQIFLRELLFSPIIVTPTAFHTHLHLHVSLTRTNGQNLGTFHKKCVFFLSEIEERCTEKHSKCLCYSYTNRM